jgi:uncharacterized protein (DUF885 family)
MNGQRIRGALALCAFAFLWLATARRAAGAAGDAAFDRLVDAYYAGFSAAHPSSATALGIHDHDRLLDDLSAAAVQREIARLKQWDGKFAAVDVTQLDPTRVADQVFVRTSIASSLVDLEDVRSWQRRPDLYTGVASQGVYVIIKRDFAPAAERLRSVVARERAVPGLFAEGKRNLHDVPKVWVDIALDQMEGTVGFFQNDVPLAFAAVTNKDAQAEKELKESTALVVSALRDYEAFLRKLGQKATGSFALGEPLFRKKLLADEMIDTPIEALLTRGEAELHRLQTEFKRTAARISPGTPPAEVQLALQKDHGTPDQLISETQSRLQGLRRFLVEKGIVTLPSEVMPKVTETPPFMRATTMASMDTPGAYEKHATEAYYNVTLPEKAWSAAQTEDFMRGAFNRPLIDVVSIHEAFPGHYVQFLWLPQIASKVRKFEAVSSNAEGWAHYCEQMILDEGYGKGDPKLRLAQLQDALLRAARYVVGIRMHTRGMTLEEAVAFFQKEGYQTKAVAEMETRRGTLDPTYLYYTAGKLEILKLREEYRAKLGPAFTLRKFHDALLKEGALPLPLVRKALLSN